MKSAAVQHSESRKQGAYFACPDRPTASVNGHAETPLPLPPCMQGAAKCIHLSSGLILGYEQYDVVSDFREDVDSEDVGYLQLHMRLSGRSRIDAGDVRDADIQSSTFSAFIHPQGATKTHIFMDGEHHESITILCDAQRAAQLFAPELGWIPRLIGNFVEQRNTGFYLANIPMMAEMAFTARTLLHGGNGSPSRSLYLESKALELVSYSLDALQTQAEGSPYDKTLSRHDLERLREAYELVRTNHIKPYAIRDLARMVGLNEPKLCTAFKAVYGTTIYNFILRLRMQHALQLLHDTNESITEIAFRVGYEYPSNFATAFKKVIGISPTAVRAGKRCRRTTMS